MNTTPTNLSFVPGDGQWPHQRHSVLDWLMNETRTERYIDNLFVDLCERLNAAGIPITRATLHFRTYHPQWLGARIFWHAGNAQATIHTFDYGMEKTPEFLLSPAFEIYQGSSEVRQRLEEGPFERSWPLLNELVEQGSTDYVAWPMDHTLGRRHFVSFSTREAGGFKLEHFAFLKDLVPALSLITEIRLKNVLARTLLETYVGPHASEQILAGATTRGSGATVSAAILICDLRDFTQISDLWQRDDVIEMLNAYFDAISEPIEKNGGEILKFLGDGLLAVFPLTHARACADLLDSIRQARGNMAALNEQNHVRNRPMLNYGIGVHVGDVMYGNIGSSKRLDFTVIGPAVNIASRLESLTKEIGRSVLVSGAFADEARCYTGLERMGLFPLRGLGEPIEVFALNEANETCEPPGDSSVITAISLPQSSHAA
ncbi:adenylate/guanylate cyclase domain-containing protein [Ensifer sp. 4252]|uniref:adenylate/guanylate cyclase domain-containing protein n=1 Tax=Ensifer sp. 4252 TaxID=3373915 RepID=UPI003D2050C1